MLRFQYVETRQLLKAQLKWHYGRNFLKTFYSTTMKVVNADKHLPEKFRGSPYQKIFWLMHTSSVKKIIWENYESFHFITKKKFFLYSNECELCKEYGTSGIFSATPIQSTVSIEMVVLGYKI